MTKDIFIVEACLLLRPNAGVTVENGIINWHGEINPPSNEEVTNKADELQKKHNEQEYARNRKADYPDWGTQLNKIYDDGLTKWKSEMVDPVKAKWPKDNSGPK